MQFPPFAAARVVEYLRKVDPDAVDSAVKVFATLRPPARVVGPEKSPPDRGKTTAEGIADLLRQFDAKKDTYIARSSLSDFALSERLLQIVRQGEEVWKTDQPRIRDRYMAENARWLLDQEKPAARMMIWAHNGHVSFGEGPFVYKPMGAYLKEMLGAR